MLLPDLPAARCGVVELVSATDTSVLLAGRGQATQLAVLVDRVADPVDACVTADCLVLRIDENDLEVLVGGVCVDPVRVEDAQVGAATTDSLLGDGA